MTMWKGGAKMLDGFYGQLVKERREINDDEALVSNGDKDELKKQWQWFARCQSRLWLCFRVNSRGDVETLVGFPVSVVRQEQRVSRAA